MSEKQARKAIIAAFIVVALVAVWIVGKRSGARDAYEVASTQLSSADAQAMITQLQNSLRASEIKLSESDASLKSRTALVETLQRRLDEQMQLDSKDQRDLALYRRIENAAIERREIDLDSIVWSATQPGSVELTLVQWNGRGVLAGVLNLSVFYAPASEAVSGNQADETKQTDENLTGLMVDSAPVDFEFRFFQKITMRIPSGFVDSGTGNTADRVPNYLIVRITPTNRFVNPVEIRVPWTDISE